MAREPNGQRQRKWTDRAASEVRRLREAAWRGLRDAEWGTELGRLFLEGKIEATQYSAGRRWRRDVAAYHNAIDIFPVRSASLERGKAMPPDPDSEEGRKQAEHDREAIETFFEAHVILVMSGGEKFVRSLVERDEPLPGHAELLLVKRGLTDLAKHYALTEQRKYGSNREIGKSE